MFKAVWSEERPDRPFRSLFLFPNRPQTRLSSSGAADYEGRKAHNALGRVDFFRGRGQQLLNACPHGDDATVTARKEPVRSSTGEWRSRDIPTRDLPFLST